MSNAETAKREIKGLLTACKKLNLFHGYIITYEREDEIIEDGITITFIPFYKWALRTNKGKRI